MMNVSIAGGLSDSSANSHRNGHSGRGLAPASAGSGGPVGPFGPSTAAMITTTVTASAENNTSLSSASPRNGTPSSSVLLILGVVRRRVDILRPAPAGR